MFLSQILIRCKKTTLDHDSSETYRILSKWVDLLYTLNEHKYINTVKSICTNHVIYRLNIDL